MRQIQYQGLISMLDISYPRSKKQVLIIMHKVSKDWVNKIIQVHQSSEIFFLLSSLNHIKIRVSCNQGYGTFYGALEL